MAQEFLEHDFAVAQLFVAETDGKAWTTAAYDSVVLTPGGIEGDRHNRLERPVRPFESVGLRGLYVDNDRGVTVGEITDMEEIAEALGLYHYEEPIGSETGLAPSMWMAACLAVNVLVDSPSKTRLNASLRPGYIAAFGDTSTQITGQLRITGYNPACARPARAMLAACRELGITPWPELSDLTEQDQYRNLGERLKAIARSRRGWTAAVRSRQDPTAEQAVSFTIARGQRMFLEAPELPPED